MSADDLRVYAEALARDAPPLSPEQQSRLAVLFGGGR